MNLLEDARALAGELTELREALHREPEIGLQLPRTQEKLLAALEGLPLEVTTGHSTTSITAVLRGRAAERPGREAPVVLLRGDMDALPIIENADVPYRSNVPGAMHACGHDLHSAMLVGAAHLLSAQQDRMSGDVVFMFQPGEEGFDGAGHMIAEGVLDAAGRRADAAYALHVFAAHTPHRVFTHRPGVCLAASDELHVTVHGAGGHGSAPHRANDPVTAVAAMVQGLQTLVTRQFDIFDPVVVSVGLLQAGTKANIIPDTAHFEATVRSFSPAARERLRDGTTQMLRGIAHAHGVEVDVDYVEQYPVTVNDDTETAFVAATVAEVFGEERSHSMPVPLGGSEDFSRVLSRVPGSFIGLGAAPPGVDPETAPYNHSPDAVFDSGVLPHGSALSAELAVRRLEALAAVPS